VVAAVAVLAVAATGLALAFVGSSAADAPGEPAPPRGLATRLVDATTPTSGGLVRWTTRWELSWQPVPGAREYAVSAVGPEGEASSLMQTVREPRLSLSVAAGTTSEADRERNRDGQVAYRATQLGVRVAAVFADGTTGPLTEVIPVGAQLTASP
jgi:hypothetical protein